MKEKEAGWERIAEQLIQDLRNGKYSPGDKLPSENKLAGEFQVPRSDVRRAYSRLKELGYIYSLQGYGSFFAGKKEKIPLAMVGRTSFSEKMKELGIPFRSENIRAKRISYNPSIYENQIEEGLVNEEDLRIIHESPDIPGSPIAIQKDLPQELKDKVKEFLLNYDDPEYFGDEEGKEPERFVEISDSDYDYLADLKETYNLSD